VKINSIFSSINGEVSALGQGSLCTFIRLQGCNLRCSYCDTKQAQDYNKGIELTIKEIYRKVQSLKSTNITITGGEPLEQEGELLFLVKMLHLGNFNVSIETNGSFNIPHWGGYIQSWIADWKTPSSGVRDKMKFSNFENLQYQDYVKFVVKDPNDFQDAVSVIKKFNKQKGLLGSPRFAFSPVIGIPKSVKPEILVEWMQREPICIKYSVILNLQLHKIIGVS
jgi:7-carboxy-7-deazaguanine synthase